MKKYLYFLGVVMGFSTLSFHSSQAVQIEKYFEKNGHKNASGAPTGRTGAPGEQTCTGCHIGTTLDGSNENILTVMDANMNLVSSYLPGENYTITLAMSSNPAKKGFQATALTSTAAMAGSFMAGSNTSITGTTKKYANHKSTSNTDATTIWDWTWTAPLSSVGEVTFYVATNKANNNGTSSGDQIFLSQFTLTSSAGISGNNQQSNQFKAAYVSKNRCVSITFSSLAVANMFMSIGDINGKILFSQDLGSSVIGMNNHQVALPDDIKEGIYFVHFFLNNKAMSAKIRVL